MGEDWFVFGTSVQSSDDRTLSHRQFCQMSCDVVHRRSPTVFALKPDARPFWTPVAYLLFLRICEVYILEEVFQLP